MATSGENIWTAASDGDTARVDFLLRTGTSVNVQDQLGYSPLHAASSYGHTELLTLLLNAGASVTLRDGDGDTPLHVCEDATCAELLIKAGADSTALNNARQTPIDVAREEQRVDLLRVFALQAGLDMRFSFQPAPEGGDAGEGTGASGMDVDASSAAGASAGATTGSAAAPSVTPSAVAHADQLRAQGNELFGAGQHAAALAKYSEALEANPRCHRCLSNRSACHAAAGDWASAAEDAQRCTQVQPSFTKGHYRFAMALLRLGDQNALQALVVVQQALQMSPGNGDLIALQRECESVARAAVAAQQQQRQAAASAPAAPAGATAAAVAMPAAGAATAAETAAVDAPAPTAPM
eukprot:g7600.t1